MSFWDELEGIGSHMGDALAWGWAWAQDQWSGTDENVTTFVNDRLAEAGYTGAGVPAGWSPGAAVAGADDPTTWTADTVREIGNAVGEDLASVTKKAGDKLGEALEWLPWVVGGGLAVGVVVLAVIYLPRPRG